VLFINRGEHVNPIKESSLAILRVPQLISKTRYATPLIFILVISLFSHLSSNSGTPQAADDLSFPQNGKPAEICPHSNFLLQAVYRSSLLEDEGI
jgi:hypothetical protein